LRLHYWRRNAVPRRRLFAAALLVLATIVTPAAAEDRPAFETLEDLVRFAIQRDHPLPFPASLRIVIKSTMNDPGRPTDEPWGVAVCGAMNAKGETGEYEGWYPFIMIADRIGNHYYPKIGGLLPRNSMDHIEGCETPR
jgi:hypothetical protein